MSPDEAWRGTCIEERELFDATAAPTGYARQQAQKAAKRVCRLKCPVVRECFADALTRVWAVGVGAPSVQAGVTFTELRKMLKARRKK